MSRRVSLHYIRLFEDYDDPNRLAARLLTLSSHLLTECVGYDEFPLLIYEIRQVYEHLMPQCEPVRREMLERVVAKLVT